MKPGDRFLQLITVGYEQWRKEMLGRIVKILVHFPEPYEMSSDLFIHCLSDCAISLNKREDADVKTTDQAQKFLWRMLQRAAWRCEQQRKEVPTKRDPDAGANCLVQPGRLKKGIETYDNDNNWLVVEQDQDDKESEFEEMSSKLIRCIDWLEETYGHQYAATVKLLYFSDFDKNQIKEMLAQGKNEHRAVVNDAMLAMRLWMENEFIQDGVRSEITATSAIAWVWNCLGKEYATAMTMDVQGKEIKKSAEKMGVSISEYKRLARQAQIACLALYGVRLTS